MDGKGTFQVIFRVKQDMKKIESASQKPLAGLTPKIQDFWTRNVNAEVIYGKPVSLHERGTSDYFKELADQRYRSHRHLINWISSMIPGKSVLEIGCGIGLDSYTMVQHGLSVNAMDLTFIGVKTAYARFNSEGLNPNLVVGNAEKIAFPENAFDYVYSFGVLHHISDTQQGIDEVYRVLRKGGEAKIMLYNRRSLNELAHQILRVPFEDASEVCPVVRRFTKTEVLQMMHMFESVDIRFDYLFGEGYGRLFNLFPVSLYNLLSKYFGWHIMITAKK
jgi:ubiquinone/menaquinone biosynthesis C-methylase UbiE